MPQRVAVFPKKFDYVILNEDEEAPSVLNPMTGQILVTNQVGQAIFEMADGQHHVDDMLARILGKFPGAREDVVREDIDSFLQDGFEKGLLE